MAERDTRSRLEDEGIPDLQDGTPQQQWARDPEESPLPGEKPVALDEYGTTAEEQRAGEPLDLRLSRERPDRLTANGDDPDAPWPAWTPSAEPAGRLVEPDEGVRADTEQDAVASDVGVDGGGYSAEEDAMHLEPE